MSGMDGMPGAQKEGRNGGVKLALFVIVLHFTVVLMLKFAAILLPFIMALMLCSVMEPVKKLVLEALEGTLLAVGQRTCCQCFIKRRKERIGHQHNLGDMTKRTVLLLAIIFTLVLCGRLFWIVGRLVWLSGEAVIEDARFYEQGIQKRQTEIKALLQRFDHGSKVHVDVEHATNLVFDMLRLVLAMAPEYLFSGLTQLGMCSIFALFLLYSPPLRDSSPAMSGVVSSMEIYLKLKTMISIAMGITNGVALAIIGLELPAAWGLLTFLANFIPYVGAPIVSFVPCLIAYLDIRKSLYQVIAALIAQLVLHFNISNFVEPIVFGVTEEIHSVVVVLGLSFFGYVWGVAGMILGVPIMSAMRAYLEVVAKSPTASADAKEDSRFITGILAGRWLASTEANDDGIVGDIALTESLVHESTQSVPLSPGSKQPSLDGSGVWGEPPRLSDVPGSLADGQEDSLELDQAVDQTQTSVASVSGLESFAPDPATCCGVDCSFPFTWRDDDTGSVMLSGVLLRWLVILVVVFFFMTPWGLDVNLLVHPERIGSAAYDVSARTIPGA